MSSYDLLIQRLDQFTRKYYLNKLIKGSLYTVAITLALFLLFNLLEHQFYFSKVVRRVFFFSFLLVSLGSVGYLVLLPLLRYFNLGSTISHEKAADIIGNHFSNVKDKLLNILQLNNISNNQTNKELIEASIDQKIENIKIVPFKSAVDLSVNKKYLKYVVPPFLILLILLFAAPSLIKDSTYRIINNDKEFEKDALFSFMLPNEDLVVLQGEDYYLNLKVEGQVIPSDVFIQFEDFSYKLEKEDVGRFGYTFKNVQKDIDFTLFSGNVDSKKQTLKILPTSSITDFSLSLNYPSYTGRKDEVIHNIGDAFIPQGTQVNWLYTAENTDNISFRFDNGKIYPLKKQRKKQFSFTKNLMKSSTYSVYANNKYMPAPDSASYSLSVTPDNYPIVSVEQFIDSIDNTVRYFVGDASDDYGIQSLKFHYQIINEKGVSKIKKAIDIEKQAGKEITYNYILSSADLGLLPGDRLSYYFEVYDNDQINGSKSAKTETILLEKPTKEAFEEEEDANEEEIKEDLKEALKESKDLQEALKKLREKLLQKKEPSWQDQKELEKLLEKQKEIDEKIKKAKEKFEKNLENQEEFTERKEEILKKQEQIQKLFEESVDKEMQQLMEQIQELMQELNKDEMMEKVEDFEQNEEKMEQEMDRLLELFKQLEVEKEIQDQIEKLKELAEEQEKLAEETKNEEKPQEELKKEQEKLNEELEKVKKALEEIEKKNEELEFPKSMDEEENADEMEDIQEEMEKSQENLEKKENSDASKKQKSAAQKMEKMAESLQQQMESGEQEQAEEDMKALRQLLENLVTLSFDQEDLVSSFSKSTVNTPRYVSLVQNQFKLNEDFELISDSLFALSKRVSELETFVTDKVHEVEFNMAESLVNLEERKKPEAQNNQRKTMTNVNDLALMLSEAMNQMQQQMASGMPGSQMCKKPGGGSPKPGQKGNKGSVPMDKISEGQKQLGEQMKKMGKGQKGKNGSGDAKSFAEAAAKQAALRKALEEIKKEQQEQGKGGQGLQEVIDQMNKIEIDLVNKRLNNDLLNRQQDIETRLLEAEKADRKREYDNKREAESGKDIKRTMPKSIQEYIKNKKAEIDVYRKVSPELRPYYKQLVDKYYNALKNS